MPPPLADCGPGCVATPEQPISAKAVGGGIAAAAAGVIALATMVVKPWEGVSLTPYTDIVGVRTVCYGETHAPMRKYTLAECDELLQSDLGRRLADLGKCIHQPLRENEWAALLSWSYNVGTAAACKSTLVRKVNAGAGPAEFCPELLRWNRAGGREVRGLTNRRKAEYRLCLGES